MTSPHSFIGLRERGGFGDARVIHEYVWSTTKPCASGGEGLSDIFRVGNVALNRQRLDSKLICYFLRYAFDLSARAGSDSDRSALTRERKRDGSSYAAAAASDEC